jgi:hypothetical protein
MIFFPDVKAFAKCEAKECEAATPLVIVMAADGTFGAGAPAWQFLPGTDGAMHSFCADHHQAVPERPLIQPIPPGVQVGPRGVRPMNGHGKVR